MKKKMMLLLSALVLVASAGGIAGCKSVEEPSGLDESAVRAYADAATETTLQGLSEDDLAKYIQNGNAQFKAAVTQAILDQAYNQINGQLGAYKSKEFLGVEEQQGYIVVHYKATYEKGEAGVRMVFDSDHLVAGQFFE